MNKPALSKDFFRNLPNKLTLSRAAAVPLLLLLYPLGFQPLKVMCAFLFAIAAFTDMIDGYLARKYENVTSIGALLDPIADKMLTTAGLLLIAQAGNAPVFLIGLLICRDIAVNGMRMIASDRQFTIEVHTTGKWKTAVMSVAIFCLMINAPLLELPLRPIGMILLWVSIALSLHSAWQYAVTFIEKTKTSLIK
jgi:CDP-diacylglycerol--glycerol-3-phosphate 3-phosphatidyltransferase